MVTRLRMRFQVKGCRNRHWFNLVIANNRKFRRDGKHIEQIGAYDPFPNKFGHKLVCFDYDRIRYWLGVGAKPTPPVSHLLGLAGVLPVYPPTLQIAAKRRKMMEENKKKEELQKMKLEQEKKLEEEKRLEQERESVEADIKPGEEINNPKEDSKDSDTTS